MEALRGIYHYHWLEPLIATAGQPDAEEILLIAQHGYQLVINLALQDADYSLHNERDLVEKAGMLYEHHAVDWSSPAGRDLEWFFSVMQKHRDKKKFIHCAANMRVSVFMALYRMIKQGWGYDAAMEDVLCIWTPDEVWQSFISQRLDEQQLLT